jgi:hypothetical protein
MATRKIKKIIYEDEDGDEDDKEAPAPRDPRQVGLERRYRNQRTLQRNWTAFCSRHVQLDPPLLPPNDPNRVKYRGDPVRAADGHRPP